jgi:hypothetical protein
MGEVLRRGQPGCDIAWGDYVTHVRDTRVGILVELDGPEHGIVAYLRIPAFTEERIYREERHLLDELCVAYSLVTGRKR